MENDEEIFIDKFEKLEEEVILLSMEKLKKIISNDTKQSDQLEAIKFIGLSTLICTEII